MNAKQQLAYNLNIIITSYNENNNIHRFYKKLNYLNTNIYKNSSKELYMDYKYHINKIYDNIINGEDDVTIINDFIYTLRYILLGLLVFE